MNRKLHIAALALQVLTFSACGGGEKKDETAAKVEAREEHLAERRALAEQIRRNSEAKKRGEPIRVKEEKGVSNDEARRNAFMKFRQKAMQANGGRTAPEATPKR